MIESQLGALADPLHYRAPLSLGNRPTDALISGFAMMTRIRLAEEAVAGLVQAGEARCPCHLSIGQEAVPVGVSTALRSSDRIYGGHRSHGHYLALGGSLDGMIAEILGKATGSSRGMGGSMHLYEPAVGFMGSVPIVGATIPVATGAAWAAKRDGRGDIAIAYFGDGACEEGVLHESLNMASVMALPILFVCENNLYSSHLDIALRQPSDSVARFARATGMACEVVDGNDVLAVAEASRTLIERARTGGGPGFLEAVTFRWRGHVGPNEDIDVGVRRSMEELAAWKCRDPIARLRNALETDRGVEPAALDAQIEAVQAEIADALDRARTAPWPETSALMNYVYAPDAGGMV